MDGVALAARYFGALRKQSPLCRFVSPQFLFRLNAVSLYDRRNQSWKALVDFRASRRVVHLDASPFATN